MECFVETTLSAYVSLSAKVQSSGCHYSAFHSCASLYRGVARRYKSQLQAHIQLDNSYISEIRHIPWLGCYQLHFSGQIKKLHYMRH